MKKSIISIGLLIGAFLSVSAHAWIETDKVTVDKVVDWQGNKYIFYTLSDKNVCFTKAEEKSLNSLILSTMVTGKLAKFKCHEETGEYQGMTGNRVYQVEVFR